MPVLFSGGSFRCIWERVCFDAWICWRTVVGRIRAWLAENSRRSDGGAGSGWPRYARCEPVARLRGGFRCGGSHYDRPLPTPPAARRGRLARRKGGGAGAAQRSRAVRAAAVARRRGARGTTTRAPQQEPRVRPGAAVRRVARAQRGAIDGADRDGRGLAVASGLPRHGGSLANENRVGALRGALQGS